MGLLHFLYCLQENWSLDLSYQVSCYWVCSVSPEINDTAFYVECCLIWEGVLSCYLEILDKLQKHICWTGGPSLVASFEPLAHHRNVVSLSLFYRYYFSRCWSELAQLVSLYYSRGRSTWYSDRFHDFLWSFLDVITMSMSTVSFLVQLDSGIMCPYFFSFDL